ncbi:hypothetical protein [Natrarchaeobius chitinivorans]|uniref:hypothetical protein n=1 Tax=Natrarchaeobius chitinivorans TaxID=1679083 RepID=UPI001FB3ACD2|nr:hypothetical protein [Natrarchaeobius chitinivorans]
MEDGRLHLTRRFRGLTLEQATGYLEGLGGERTEDDPIEGDDWQAHLSTRIVPVGPSVRLTELTVTWTGSADSSSGSS